MNFFSIMYHDVVEGDDFEASGFPGRDAALYKLGRKQFAEQLQAIKAAAPGGARRIFDPPIGPAASFVITFDDGGASAYTTIADMLEQYGWRGHFFITTDYIGRPAFMSRTQIRELHRRGHVIGSHSCSHPARISSCRWEEIVREWAASALVLSDILGEKVRAASVPGGFYSRKVAQAASLAGIEWLFTSEPTARQIWVDGCRVLGRYTIQRWMSPQTVAGLATGRIQPRLRQMFLWNTKKLTKSLGGKYYLKARKSLLEKS